MQGMIANGVDKLLTEYGILGVVIFGLAAAVVMLWRDNKAKDKFILDLMEKRIVEGREGLTAINANTTALTGLSQVIHLLRAQH